MAVRLLKLWRTNGLPMWINPETIETIEPNDDKPGTCRVTTKGKALYHLTYDAEYLSGQINERYGEF